MGLESVVGLPIAGLRAEWRGHGALDVVVDEEGNGPDGPAENGVSYPGSTLTGSGTVAGRPVRCLIPEYRVQSHTGYELGENDLRAVVARRERFGVSSTEGHRRASDGDWFGIAPSRLAPLVTRPS